MAKRNTDLRVAVLSDTHGLLRPEVLAACAGADHILHAGDVGDPAILQWLGQVAPVHAIRGNVDTEGPCSLLPSTEMVLLGERAVYMVHSVADLDIKPEAAGVSIVISGHSHKAAEERRNGVLYLNPGSVGPRRFRLPVTMAFLSLAAGEIGTEIRTFDA